jgi:replicative DNA helicase
MSCPELSVIKLFLDYQQWEKYKGRLSVRDLPRELQPVFSILDNYHSSNEAKADLTVADLANLLVAISSKDKDYYLGVLEQIQTLEVSADTTAKLVQRIIANKQLNDISLAAHDAKEGRKTLEEVNALLEQFRALQEQKEEEQEEPYISDDLDFLVHEVYLKPGLKWRLNTLNRMLGSLRNGDFGYIFARPESGKTTLIASELTYMAEQATGDVIWLANEEEGKKVMVRLYQATFGIDLPTLLSDVDGWKKAFREKYGTRLKVISDLSLMNKDSVKRLCDKLKPSLLVIDQLSKIQGFKDDRKDLELGAACEWGRIMAKLYCPVVAVHQADGTAEGVKWLNMNHVSNAKTAMQAEADWILGIGKSNDPGYESLRYLALSKNKLAGDAGVTDPNLKHGKMEVLIEPHRARYKDIT